MQYLYYNKILSILQRPSHFILQSLLCNNNNNNNNYSLTPPHSLQIPARVPGPRVPLLPRHHAGLPRSHTWF